MATASLLDGPALDVLAPFQDAVRSTEVDISGGEVVQALVLKAKTVVVDEVGGGASRARSMILLRS